MKLENTNVREFSYDLVGKLSEIVEDLTLKALENNETSNVPVLKANAKIELDENNELVIETLDFSITDKEAFDKNRKEVKHYMAPIWETLPVIKEYYYDANSEKWYSRYKITSNSPMLKLFDYEQTDRRVELSGYKADCGPDKRYKFYDTIISVRTPGSYDEAQKVSRGFIINDKDQIIPMKNSKIFNTTKEAKEDIEQNGEYNYYKAACWGPSGEKKGSKFFFKTLKSKEQIKEVFAKLDSLTGGAFKSLFTEEQETAYILKNMSRWGNYSSGMRLGYKINLKKDYVLYIDCKGNAAGDFDEKTESELADKGIDFGHNINDGKSYQNAEVWAEYAKKNKDLKGNINKIAAFLRRNAPQTRASHFNTKVMSESLMNSEMQIQAEMFEKLYGDKCHKYGNTSGRCAMIVDKDGAKLLTKISNKDTVNVYVLNIADCSESNTSGQMLSKCLAKDANKTVEFAKELARKQLLDAFKGSTKQGYASPDKGAIDNMLSLMDPDEVIFDYFLMKNKATTVKAMSKKIWASDRIKVKSLYNHAMFDDAYAISGGAIDRVLKTREIFGKRTVEVFSYDVYFKFKDEIEAIENSNYDEDVKTAMLDSLLTATIIKYPSAGKEEFLSVRYLTLKEYLQRIDEALDNSNLDDDMKEYFKGRYVNLAYGVTLYAAYNFIKNKLAGMDVDYDGTVAIFDSFKWILFFGDNIVSVIDYKYENKELYKVFDENKDEDYDEDIYDAEMED